MDYHFVSCKLGKEEISYRKCQARQGLHFLTGYELVCERHMMKYGGWGLKPARSGADTRCAIYQLCDPRHVLNHSELQFLNFR